MRVEKVQTDSTSSETKLMDEYLSKSAKQNSKKNSQQKVRVDIPLRLFFVFSLRK